jgi:AraC-like DNA-binding protein
MKHKVFDNKRAREFLLGHFDNALEQIAVRAVCFAVDTPLPPYPAISFPQTRIVVPLTGRKIVRFAGDGQIQEKTFLPGHLFYSVKNCWALPLWTSAHSMLSVAFSNGNSYVRVLYIENDGTYMQNGPDVWYHTGRGLDGAGVHLLQSLNLMSRQPGASNTREAALLTEALLILSRNILEQDNPDLQSKAQRTFLNVKQYVAENCSQPVNRDSIAADMNLNPGYLSRLFKRFTGESFNAFLTDLRMNRAAQLLKMPVITIDDVSRQCGYSDTGYFIKLFKRHYGTTPGRYKPKN